MTFNAGDRKDIRKAEKEARQVDRTRHEVLRSLLDTTAGRTYLYDQLAASHIFASSFTLEPLATAFAEGERNLALPLFNDILEIAPDKFVLMMREANARSSTKSQPGSGDDEPDFFNGPGDFSSTDLYDAHTGAKWNGNPDS